MVIVNVFCRYEVAVFDEMKKLQEIGHHFCKICKRIFSSESEHYELTMAEYSDWIFEVDDKKDVNSSNHDPIVFTILREKFSSVPSEPHPSSPNNNAFCWTEDMFKSQFQMVDVLLEENDFMRANATCFGILMEIEKISTGKDGKSIDNLIFLCYRLQLRVFVSRQIGRIRKIVLLSDTADRDKV